MSLFIVLDRVVVRVLRSVGGVLVLCSLFCSLCFGFFVLRWCYFF